MRTLNLGLMLLAAAALPLAAQERKGLVEIDHASGNARFIYFDGRRTDTTDVGVNPTVRVPRGVNVQVRVVGTNSALYRFTTAEEKVPVPDFESVMSLVVRSAPYVPQLSSVADALGSRFGGDVVETMEAQAEADSRGLAEASDEMSAALERMTRARQGRGGVQQVLTATLSSLDRMRLGAVPEVANEELRALLPEQVRCGADAPVRLNSAQELLAGVFQAARAQFALRDAIAGPTYPDQLSWKAAYDSALVVEKRSKDALANFEDLVNSSYRIVYRLERLAGIVAGACSRVDVASVKSTLSGGRAVKVDAVPRGESELIRLADFGSDSWTVTVLPRVLLSPSVSVGGLAAPQGRLPLYGTAASGAGREVVQTGSTDARFTPAGMLGLTYGFLDRREIDGFAIWLPELVIGAGSTPTFGVGAAVSYKFMRLGVGGAWMRYRGLNGMSEGSIISDPSELRTTDTYGKPRMYLTLSVFDWSPLAKRLQ